MATRLQIRRGTGTTPPDDIRAGELAFSTDVGMLFVGTGEAIPNHYKLINSIENLGDLQITADSTELNVLNGILASTSELNILNGVTVNANELNLLGEGNYTEPLGTDDFQNLINLTTLLNSKSDTDHTHTLGQLSNVSNTVPTSGQVLKWNGSVWAPAEDFDEAVNLQSLGITVTAANLNAIDDKLSKTATGQVITQNITMGPIAAAGENADSRKIIFNSTTSAGDGANVFRSLGTNNQGHLIFGEARVLTTGTVGEEFLQFTEEQTLTTNQKETALGNLGVTATPTELNYTAGVTSAIQTQLTTLSNDKAPKNSPQFTGTPTLDANPNTNDVSTKIATTAFVNGRIQSLVLGSGTYTETSIGTLEDSDTFLFNDLLGSYDKILFTLYLVKANSSWFSTGEFEGATVQVFPSLELNRIENTFTSAQSGTCSDPAHSDQQSCEFNGGTWTGDEVTVYQNGKVIIGNGNAVVKRISSTAIQFTEPTSISGFTWKLRITGVTF
jgi:hypothetical protein